MHPFNRDSTHALFKGRGKEKILRLHQNAHRSCLFPSPVSGQRAEGMANIALLPVLGNGKNGFKKSRRFPFPSGRIYCFCKNLLKRLFLPTWQMHTRTDYLALHHK